MGGGHLPAGILPPVTAGKLMRKAAVLCASAALLAAVNAVPASGARTRAAASQKKYAHLYWSEPESTRGPSGHGIDNIWRANLNGTGVNRKFVTGLQIPWGIATDRRYLYWADSEAATLGRADINGGRVDRSLIQAEADALAVRAHYIYWTEGSFPGQPATIWRADLEGSHVHKLASVGTGTFLGGLAVGARYIYWTNLDKGTIGRVNINGSHVDRSLIAGIVRPRGLAVHRRQLYWTSDPVQGNGSIGRASVDGSHVQKSFLVVAPGPSEGLVIGAGHIYWANYENGNIGRVRIDGTHMRQDFIKAAVKYDGFVGATPDYLALGP